jgi:predicted MFS family arabinose efflux permease
MIVVHKFDGKRHPLLFMAIGVLITGAGFVCGNLLPPCTWAAICIMLFLTLGEIMSMPFMNSFWISRAKTHNIGQYAALYSMAWSVAQIAAPVLGGQIVENKGYSTLWWLLGVISIITAAGCLLLYRVKFKPKAPLPGSLAVQ